MDITKKGSFSKATELLGDFAKKEIAKKVRNIALAVQTEAKVSIGAKKSSGRSYKISKRKTHVASAAGNPPNKKKGQLIKSITLKPFETGKSWDVGTNLDYGKFLEFGTRNMAARPWLSAAVEAKGKKEFADQVVTSFREQMKEIKKNSGKKSK